MTRTINQRLWRQLNAFADGELEGEPRTKLEAALAEDPSLREALERIVTVKRGLAAGRPEPETDVAAANWKRPAAAVAACAFATVLAIATFLPLKPELSWQEELVLAHAELSEATFVVEQNRPLPVVSSRRLHDFAVPDLRASRLYFVEARNRREENIEQVAMHYRGLRGCALTIAAMAPISEGAEGAALPSGDKTLLASWRVGKLGFAVIAEGMDEARFRAITDYVKAAIDDSLTPKKELRMAMEESYRAAMPCA